MTSPKLFAALKPRPLPGSFRVSGGQRSVDAPHPSRGRLFEKVSIFINGHFIREP